jgi:ankyrin repeat protein
VDINASNIHDEGWTALHYAAHEGLDETVEFLIRKCNANVNVTSTNGRTPLHIACNRQNRKVIERLLLGGANANL